MGLGAKSSIELVVRDASFAECAAKLGSFDQLALEHTGNAFIDDDASLSTSSNEERRLAGPSGGY